VSGFARDLCGDRRIGRGADQDIGCAQVDAFVFQTK
jgi:hypothetical protein